MAPSRNRALLAGIGVLVSAGMAAPPATGQCLIRKIVPDESVAGDTFGWSVDLHDHLAAGGATGDLRRVTGTEWLFGPSPDWLQVARLAPADGEETDYFGSSSTFLKGQFAVGAQRNDPYGSIYVYECRDDEWGQVQKLVPNGPAFPARFGQNSAYDGESLLVGAPFDTGGSAEGAAYVFEMDGNGDWVQRQRLFASDAERSDRFGFDVAIEGDYLIAGAINGEGNGPDSGAAYIFERDGNGNWTESQKIFAQDVTDRGQFGEAVAISNSIIMAGAPEHNADTGVVSVFEQKGDHGPWLEVQTFRGDDANGDDLFGEHLDLDGDTAVIGARAAVIDGKPRQGAAYMFRRHASGVWKEVAKITAKDGQAEDRFGWSVALDGDRVLIGAIFDNVHGEKSGSAYLFRLPPRGFPAEITRVRAHRGDIVEGGLDDLLASDGHRLTANSEFAFLTADPNLIDLRIDVETDEPSPQSISLEVESFITQPDGTTRLRLLNRGTNQWDTVHTYSLGTEEHCEHVEGIPAAAYTRAIDGKISLSIRTTVVASFSLTGFRAHFDHVGAYVE